jgi:hypothetical protein
MGDAAVNVAGAADHFRDGGIVSNTMLQQMRCTLRHRVWIAMPPPGQGVVVHDVHREDGCDTHGANAHD